jgi:hypothetical protein
MAGLRSMMPRACLRSMIVAGLRSMLACSGLESRTTASSGGGVKDGCGVIMVDGYVL